jgi:hypothetical protein
MFGLRGLIKLLLGEDSSALDESRQMQAQMGMGMGGGNQMGFNADAAFKVRLVRGEEVGRCGVYRRAFVGCFDV